VFRGRVHQFASSVISIADKSAINMRGDYGEVVTTWEEEVPDVKEEAIEVKVDEEGDVEMKVDVDIKEEKVDAVVPG
jgi:THO complex subunit 1